MRETERRMKRGKRGWETEQKYKVGEIMETKTGVKRKVKRRDESRAEVKSREAR